MDWEFIVSSVQILTEKRKILFLLPKSSTLCEVNLIIDWFEGRKVCQLNWLAPFLRMPKENRTAQLAENITKKNTIIEWNWRISRKRKRIHLPTLKYRKLGKYNVCIENNTDDDLCAWNWRYSTCIHALFNCVQMSETELFFQILLSTCFVWRLRISSTKAIQHAATVLSTVLNMLDK